jgi:hypothetical protein
MGLPHGLHRLTRFKRVGQRDYELALSTILHDRFM